MNKGGHNDAVSQVETRPEPPPASNPQPETCRWCGMTHGPLCPYVKAFEFDPTTGAVTRVEFLVPTDYPRQSGNDTHPSSDSYPKLGDS